MIAHEKPGSRRTWAPQGQHGYFLGPAMHHYRCQNVYISSTGSERILDTLEFFPQTYQMQKLSSTYRLIISAKDIMGALQNPQPEVPFAQIRDDTILTLAELAVIFKLKLQHTPHCTLPDVPLNVTQGPCLYGSYNQLIASPVPIARHTRFEKTTHTQDIATAPLPPKVVTPRTLSPSPLTVHTRSRILSPHNLSQNDFCGMATSHMAIALGDNHWSQRHKSNTAIHPISGKDMEYTALMEDPRLQPLWK
jgi:hypothetical protein